MDKNTRQICAGKDSRAAAVRPASRRSAQTKASQRRHFSAPPSAPPPRSSRRCPVTAVCTFGATCCRCCSVCSLGRRPGSHLARRGRRAAAFVLRGQYNAIYFHYSMAHRRQRDPPTFNNKGPPDSRWPVDFVPALLTVCTDI